MHGVDPSTLRSIKAAMARLHDPVEGRRYVFSALGLDRYLSRRKIFKVGSIPIHCEAYEHDGGSPTVLFIPGLGTYSEMFCELLATLSEAGLNVVGVDLRGHGYSGGARGRYTVRQVVADVSEVVTEVTRRYGDRIGIFGCSIGAPLAVAAAENDPRIKAALCHTLFLAECPPDLLHCMGWSWLGWSAAFMPGARVDFRWFIDVDRVLTGSVLGHFARYDDLIVWEYPIDTLASVYSHKSKVLSRKLGFKAAIVLGECDEIVSLRYEQYLIQRMRHPFELIVMPGGRHMLPLEKVGETARVAGEWLRAAL